MKKILSHWVIVILNLPVALINSGLVAIRAYSDKPIKIAPIYILFEVIFYLIWIIYGFINGRKSDKSFLVSIVIYWGIASICLISLPKINFQSSIHSVLAIYSLFNFIPLYTFHIAFENIFVWKDIALELAPVVMLIIMSFIGFSFGMLYNYYIFTKKIGKEY